MKKRITLVAFILMMTQMNAQQRIEPKQSQQSGVETPVFETSSEEVEALRFHNEARAEVGVDPLTWSPEISRYSQQWADYLASNGCQFKHRGSGDEGGKSYGENIAMSSGNYTLLQASKNWYSEIKDFSNAPLNENNWSVAGHYSQMVWKNTTQVGIGSAKCSNGSTIVVANYNPPGNYMGQKAY